MSESTHALEFQERLQAGRDAKDRARDRLAHLGSAVTYKRIPARIYLSVAETAEHLHVSEARVKQLIASGQIKGARRKSQGKGRGYRIPAELERGEYRVIVSGGSRGPLSDRYKAETSHGRIPF